MRILIGAVIARSIYIRIDLYLVYILASSAVVWYKDYTCMDDLMLS